MKRNGVAFGLCLMSCLISCGTGEIENEIEPQNSEETRDQMGTEHWEFGGYYTESGAHWPNFDDQVSRWDGQYPWDCDGLSQDHAFACFEQRFWEALGFVFTQREEVYDLIGVMIEKFEGTGELRDLQLGLLYFRRVHLAMAMALENLYDQSLMMTSLEDLSRAKELVPTDSPMREMIEAFAVAIEIVIPFVVPEMSAARPEAEVKLSTLSLKAEYDPAALFMFVTTASALPMSTEWPQRAADTVSHYATLCESDYCKPGSPRAPFAVHGSDWVFADIYARVGRKQEALDYLQRALTRPSAQSWPVRDLVSEYAEGIDEVIANYARVDSAEHVMDLQVSNGTVACVMCHQPEASTGRPVPVQ